MKPYLKSVKIIDNRPAVISSWLNAGVIKLKCPKCSNILELDYVFSEEKSIQPCYCCYCGKKLVRENKNE